MEYAGEHVPMLHLRKLFHLLQVKCYVTSLSFIEGEISGDRTPKIGTVLGKSGRLVTLVLRSVQHSFVYPTCLHSTVLQ